MSTVTWIEECPICSFTYAGLSPCWSNRLANVVEAHPPQASLGQRLVKDPMAQVVPIERPPFLVAEDPIGHLRPAPSERFSFPRSQQGFQSLRELGRHIYSAAPTALGRGDATSYAVASNFDKPPVEINIAPLKTQQFPQTQTCSQ